MPAFRTMTSIPQRRRRRGGWRHGRRLDGRAARRERRRTQVILLEAATLGDGASSRAAGMVRAQGGTEAAIRLGLRSQEFYAASGDRFPFDCGFVAQGYLMPCFTEAEVAQAHDRIALQQSLGLDVEWLSGADIDDRGTGLAPGVDARRLLRAGDGYIDAPRNVLAYTAALTAQGVDVRERCAFTGLRTTGGRVVGVDTTDGPIDTEPVVLTGGPQLAEVGRRGRWADPGGRYAAPGGGHRAGGRRRRLRAADGVRRDVGDLLAAGRGRRAAVGDEQPRRAARRGRRVRLRLLPEGPRPDRGRCIPAVRGLGLAADVGRHHRLHARPPADPRPAAHRRRARRGHRGRLRRRATA